MHLWGRGVKTKRERQTSKRVIKWILKKAGAEELSFAITSVLLDWLQGGVNSGRDHRHGRRRHSNV
jgi:hypothetical protein